jgi:glycosyltransferase involved in cell wall biosynthesis
MTGSSWRAFPSAANVKVWVGGGDTPRNALDLYQPASRAGRLAKAAAAACPEALAALACRGRPDAATRARLDRIAATIRERLGDGTLAVSLSPGTVGRHRKMTARAAGRAGVIAYGKVADTPEVARLLDNEAAMLRGLADRDLGPGVVPEVIGLDRADGLTLLLQGPPPGPARPRPLAPDGKDAAFLSALMGLDRRTVPLKSLFEDTPDALERDVRAALATVFPAGQAAVSAGHGDYAPWNGLDLNDGRLFVFDWEYGRRDAPLLGDLFHRVLMPARLVRKTPPARLVARLLCLGSHPILGGVIARSGVPRAELPGYLLLYLLHMAQRGRAQDGAVPPYIRDCLRAGLAAVEGAQRPRNILVAAYACEPGKGSEPGVGWHVCLAIARTHNAWVITKDNNRAPIEQALAARPNPNLHFAYVGLPRWLTFWKKGPRGVRLYYYLWQFAAWREARRLGRRVDFDLAHHVTFVNDWMFSFLALLPTPFVWGPIGSNPRIPASLAPSLRAVLIDWLRCLAQCVFRFADPLYWLSVVRARLIVGIGPAVGRTFPISLLGADKFIGHPAIGVEAGISPARHPEPGRRGVRVLTVGNFIHIKGFHLAIRAFAQFAQAHADATLLIVGRGPEKNRLAALVRALGIAGQVTFRDWLPRDEALREMSRADIFLYPSFEGGGMVVLEAMAHGLPVVCLDYGGAGEMVGEDGGIRVPVGTMGDTVAGLAAALETLANDEARRHRLGTAARDRVNARYLWDGRQHVLHQWYTELLQS